nr:M48 family metalloprotease [uncultured Sphingomonas sp.]
MRFSMAFVATSTLALAPAVAQAPATRLQQTYLDQRDVQESAKEHAALIQEFGGAETGARASYVDGIGRRVSAYSGVANPGQTLHYTTLNSPVENAFATPGGYVYITRQLMGIMNDESNLAFVLGHETGHIAARHGQTRKSAANQNNILGVLGAILGGVVGDNIFGSLISQSAQQFSKYRTLSFSRNQEYQADVLGIRYMTQAGYNPAGAGTMLSQLGRSSALEARVQGNASRSAPEWTQTHPLTQNRVTQADQAARQTGRMGSGMVNRDQFLAQLDGMMVDDDPAQGIVDGRTFTHPDLRMQFTVPTGYLMQNSASSVDIQGSAGQAQFGGGRYDGNMQAHIGKILYGLTEGKAQVAMGPVQRTTVNGIPTYVTTGRANTQSGQVDVSIIAYEWDRNTAYHFIMITQGGAGVGPFSQMINSLRRITTQEAAAIRPRVINVVMVRQGDTAQSLARRMAYRNFQLDRFLALNGLNGNSRLTPGQKVKLVVYGSRRQ